MREEVGMQFSVTGRIVRSHVIWVGHVVRMEDSRPPKSAEAVTTNEYPPDDSSSN